MMRVRIRLWAGRLEPGLSGHRRCHSSGYPPQGLYLRPSSLRSISAAVLSLVTDVIRLTQAPLVLAVMLGAPGSMRGQSTSTAMTASVAVAPVLSVRSLVDPTVQSRSATSTVMSTDLVVASNTGYAVRVRPVGGTVALANSGITMLVQVDKGAFVPVDAEGTIVGHASRGAAGTTHVTYRFEARGGRGSTLATTNLSALVAYDAVSEGSGELIRLLAEQRIAPAPAMRVAQSSMVGGDAR